MTAIATRQTVFDAADELQAEGQPVTIDAVIARIGGGSKSTVGPLLQAWQLKRKPDVEPMPESLEARARTLASVIWCEAMAKAEPRIVAARREFEIELSARDAAVEGALGQVRALEETIARIDAEWQTERARCARLMVQIEGLSAANAKLQELAPTLEIAHARSAADQGTITRLQAENGVLREQLALLAPRRKAR